MNYQIVIARSTKKHSAHDGGERFAGAIVAYNTDAFQAFVPPISLSFPEDFRHETS